jgi:DNA-3-methyladenine glycosylase II
MIDVRVTRAPERSRARPDGYRMQQSRGHAPVRRSATQAPARSHHVIAVAPPFRLDLTANALRRLPVNVVDILTPGGEYVRALRGGRDPLVVRAVQTSSAALEVTIDGRAGEHAAALATVRRVLGLNRDVRHFSAAAARMPWLRPLARRMRGVKPPRYPSLWEAFVNAVLFQQVSLQAASAIVTRLIVACGTSVENSGVSLYAFPEAQRVLAESEGELRAAGLSSGKIATLRRAGEALTSGALDERELEQLPSAEASARLRQIKGIGPWTATVILLRGLGRLDVFPMNDTSVARNLSLVGGPSTLDKVTDVLAALQPQQGMLYYHLLLARHESRGAFGPL